MHTSHLSASPTIGMLCQRMLLDSRARGMSSVIWLASPHCGWSRRWRQIAIRWWYPRIVLCEKAIVDYAQWGNEGVKILLGQLKTFFSHTRAICCFNGYIECHDEIDFLLLYAIQTHQDANSVGRCGIKLLYMLFSVKFECHWCAVAPDFANRRDTGSLGIIVVS